MDGPICSTCMLPLQYCGGEDTHVVTKHVACPFCGFTSIEVHGIEERSLSDVPMPMVYFGHCLRCGARGPRSKDNAEGGKSWDTRADPPASNRPPLSMKRGVTYYVCEHQPPEMKCRKICPRCEA